MNFQLTVLAVAVVSVRFLNAKHVYDKHEVVRQLDNESIDECDGDKLRCPSGRCIPLSSLCNGNNDCGDSFDEPDTCPSICYGITSWIKCTQLDSCVHRSALCNGVQDCRDGSDEGSFCNLRAASGEDARTTDCPPNFIRRPPTGSCYKLELTPLSWHNASLHCASLHPGAHLAFIENEYEQTTVKSLLVNFIETEWWIGGEREDSSWSWKVHSPDQPETSRPMLFTNWAPSEPNNAFAGETCVSLMNMAWWDGRWNDDACWKTKRFVCEAVA